MFQRFTMAARLVVVQACAEAADLGHRHIGTEHLLLGLLGPDAGTTAEALAEVGVRPQPVRATIRRLTGPTTGATADTEPTGPSATSLDDEDAQALRLIGIDLDAVKARIEEAFGPGALDLATPPPQRRRWWRPGRGNAAAGRLPFTDQAKKVLELSLREAVRLRHGYLGPEHLLLGLLREGDGLAARILADANVDLPALRTRVEAAARRAA